MASETMKLIALNDNKLSQKINFRAREKQMGISSTPKPLPTVKDKMSRAHGHDELRPGNQTQSSPEPLKKRRTQTQLLPPLDQDDATILSMSSPKTSRVPSLLPSSTTTTRTLSPSSPNRETTSSPMDPTSLYVGITTQTSRRTTIHTETRSHPKSKSKKCH